MTHSRLTKHPGDRVWAGVCAGIARWLGVDPVLIRLVWLAWAVFGDTGTAFLAYIALMIVLPDASREERRAEAERRGRPRHTSTHTAKHAAHAAPAAHVTPSPSAVAAGPSMPTGATSPTSPAPRSPSPTADELGDVLLKLLDATAAVAVNVARAAVLAARAAFVTGHANYRATQRRAEARPGGTSPTAAAPAAPSPLAAGDVQPAATVSSATSAAATSPALSTATATPTPDEPHIESDEERLHRQIRDRLEGQVAGARAVIGAAGPQAAARERTARRGRLRQLAGFGVLAFGAWGLATTLGLEPLALTAAALPTFASAAVVIAASLVCLGTYLLWTAVRRHP